MVHLNSHEEEQIVHLPIENAAKAKFKEDPYLKVQHFNSLNYSEDPYQKVQNCDFWKKLCVILLSKISKFNVHYLVYKCPQCVPSTKLLYILKISTRHL